MRKKKADVLCGLIVTAAGISAWVYYRKRYLLKRDQAIAEEIALALWCNGYAL